MLLEEIWMSWEGENQKWIARQFTQRENEKWVTLISHFLLTSSLFPPLPREFPDSAFHLLLFGSYCHFYFYFFVSIIFFFFFFFFIDSEPSVRVGRRSLFTKFARAAFLQLDREVLWFAVWFAVTLLNF